MDERVKRLEKCHPTNRLKCFVPLMEHRYGHSSPLVFLDLILTITEECERRAGQKRSMFHTELNLSRQSMSVFWKSFLRILI